MKKRIMMCLVAMCVLSLAGCQAAKVSGPSFLSMQAMEKEAETVELSSSSSEVETQTRNSIQCGAVVSVNRTVMTIASEIAEETVEEEIVVSVPDVVKTEEIVNAPSEETKTEEAAVEEGVNEENAENEIATDEVVDEEIVEDEVLEELHDELISN